MIILLEMEKTDPQDPPNTLKTCYSSITDLTSATESSFHNFFLDMRENFEKTQKKLLDAKQETSKHLPVLTEQIEELNRKLEILSELVMIEEKKIELQEKVTKKSEGFFFGDWDKKEETDEIRGKIGELEKVVRKFEHALGLEISRYDDSVRFIFSFISCMNPNKHFIELRIENGSFNLVACSPSLEGLDAHIESLNKTHDLTQFLKLVRTGFKMLYN